MWPWMTHDHPPPFNVARLQLNSFNGLATDRVSGKNAATYLNSHFPRMCVAESELRFQEPKLVLVHTRTNASSTPFAFVIPILGRVLDKHPQRHICTHEGRGRRTTDDFVVLQILRSWPFSGSLGRHSTRGFTQKALFVRPLPGPRTNRGQGISCGVWPKIKLYGE